MLNYLTVLWMVNIRFIGEIELFVIDVDGVCIDLDVVKAGFEEDPGCRERSLQGRIKNFIKEGFYGGVGVGFGVFPNGSTGGKVAD
ncbi:hypothetical protein PoB_006422700 [Plakobranchus ocellatus]|uniref:Uncharacterized protein n=1 Tax=Plakobranchus ocellatus TaxID=259542 RepID=A0AAV4D0Q6_9GAST|nr:hypothetical protein PoB_006422700 [Plakobranchus ocellatus]